AVFISEANSSLTLNRYKREALAKYPNASWVTYEPYGEENQLLGSQIAFGPKLRLAPDLSQAKVLISFDADFMGTGADNVRNIKAFTKGRKITSTSDNIKRLYVAEANYSLTGSNADHRLRIKSSDIKPFVYALAGRLSTDLNGLSAF